MEKKDHKRQLLSLKKELKCWESLFERKHNRKPSKSDIENSPAEIQDAYHQYRLLKTQQAHTVTTSNGQVSTLSAPSDAKPTAAEVVFGSFLNKPTKVTKEDVVTEGNTEKKSIWKLRRWTKGRGYVTVSGEGGDGVEEGSESAGESGAKETKSDIEEDADSSKYSELDNELQSLSQNLNINQTVSLKPTTDINSPTKSRPLISGECQNVFLAERLGRKSRLRHSSGISTNWLGRCKPDLESETSHKDATERQSCLSISSQTTSDSELVHGTTSDLDTDCGNDVISHGQSSILVPSLPNTTSDNDATSDFEPWSRGDVIEHGCSDIDNSDEDDPVIRSVSAGQRWSELYDYSFNPSSSATGANYTEIDDTAASTSQASPVLNTVTQCQSDNIVIKEGDQTQSSTFSSTVSLKETNSHENEHATYQHNTHHGSSSTNALPNSLKEKPQTNSYGSKHTTNQHKTHQDSSSTNALLSSTSSLVKDALPAHSASVLGRLESTDIKSQTTPGTSSSDLYFSSNRFNKSKMKTDNSNRSKQWSFHREKSQDNTIKKSRGPVRNDKQGHPLSSAISSIDDSRGRVEKYGGAKKRDTQRKENFDDSLETSKHNPQPRLTKVQSEISTSIPNSSCLLEEKEDKSNDIERDSSAPPLSDEFDSLERDLLEEELLNEFEATSEECHDLPTSSRPRGAAKPKSNHIINKDSNEVDSEALSDSDSSNKPSVVKKKSNLGKLSSTSRGGSAVSDNFVRLNMKVKRFSRKGKGLTGSAHKRLAWKKMQKGRTSGFGGGGGGSGLGKGGRSVCYKCGNSGHWARNCDASAGSKNLGKFDGETVGFSDKMATGDEEEVDVATLEQLSKESPFPSVEDAALMACGIKFGSRKEQPEKDLSDVTQASECGGSSQVDLKTDTSEALKQFIAPPPCRTRAAARSRSVEPLYPTVDGKITATPKSVKSVLKTFGYDSFRPGQEEAVMRILSGVSTLLINSTGSGKSLCYQLPAYLYCQSTSCLALVISPLVSLMEDQVLHFPVGLRGGCVHTSQTRPQREKVLKDAVEGKLNVLLLSPEALVGGALWSKSGTYSLNQLPPVAFACIDEAHCVSEWSHNFRPSYLRINKVLRERLGVYCVLALTATATYQTALSVATNLGIGLESIIRGPTLPDNLRVSVSCDKDRDQALVELLQNSTFKYCESIIIYCTRQQETERIAQILRTCLSSIPNITNSGTGMENLECDTESRSKEVNSKSKAKSRKRKNDASSTSGRGSKRQKVEWSAECYHAGLQASRRRRVQSDFMSGRLRIVVATVAFGMGLNKSDVRAIIHYNLPKSFESFVQEIGRAGRDGLPAYCHVFIDKQGSDLSELRRHAYSNTVERYCVKQLVGKAFPICQCRQLKQTSEDPSNLCDAGITSPPKLSSPRWCNGHEVAIPIESMVNKLDVKEECISTLLCYLELEGWLGVMNPVNDSCTLKCYRGARQLRALAQKVPAVAAAVARQRENGTDLDQSNTVSFSVTETADSMGWESHIVRSELNGLMFNDRGTGGATGAKSTVLVEFGTLSFHLCSPGDLTSEERDHVCDFLFSKVKRQEEREVEKLHLFHAVLKSVAGTTHHDCFQNEQETAKKLENLNKMIKRYFSEQGLDSSYLEEIGIPIIKTQTILPPELEHQVSDDIHSLVSIHSEQNFTGRAIARIFHGIASPLFEAIVWGGQKRFWRRHMDVDFNLLCQLATKRLLNLR